MSKEEEEEKFPGAKERGAEIRENTPVEEKLLLLDNQIKWSREFQEFMLQSLSKYKFSTAFIIGVMESFKWNILQDDYLDQISWLAQYEEDMDRE